jgi:hypothetical protein
VGPQIAFSAALAADGHATRAIRVARRGRSRELESIRAVEHVGSE